jgi:integrase
LEAGSKPAERKPGGLVFTSNQEGPIHESKFVGRHFKPLLRSAGLPNLRLYDLRHTAATLALSAGCRQRS